MSGAVELVEAPPGVRATATAARRAAIMDAALALFTERGVGATTIEDLCRCSGASIGSIYHHFGSKEQVAAALYLEGIRAYQEGYLGQLDRDGDPEPIVKDVVRYHLRWIVGNPALARFLFIDEPELRRVKQGPLRAANRRFLRRVTAWLERHAREGSVSVMSVDLYHALWIGPGQEFGRAWLGGATTCSPELAAQRLGDAAWQALRAPSASDA